ARSAGPNPDRRDGHRPGYLASEIGGNGLEDERERARLLDGQGIGEDLLRALAAALDLEPSEGVDALRSEPHVADHGDPRAGDAVDVLGDLLAALELHALAGAELHE